MMSIFPSRGPRRAWRRCCSLLQRFISGFSRMRTEYLQDYLNRFAFSLHVKLIFERGACEAPIMGHEPPRWWPSRGVESARRGGQAAPPSRRKGCPEGRSLAQKGEIRNQRNRKTAMAPDIFIAILVRR